jgi:ribosomal protein L37AE/L43A
MSDRYQIFERLDLARIEIINSMERPHICSHCKTIYERPSKPEWHCPGCNKKETQK